MDKCPVCGHVEATQQLINTQAMNRFVRTKDKAVGVFNNSAEHFKVPVKTGAKNADGADIIEQIEWVREDVAKVEAEKAAAKIPATPTADDGKKPAGGLILA